MSISECCFLICIQISQEAGRWSGIPISLRLFQFIVIHTVKDFGVVSKTDIDNFLELSCIICDPTDVGNLTSGSFTFLKSNFCIWNFSVHKLLKPSLDNFEHYFANMWNECKCMIVWTFFDIAFLWDWNAILFQSCGHCWVFQICWHVECSTFTASSFRIWNSSVGFPSPPLALFEVYFIWC